MVLASAVGQCLRLAGGACTSGVQSASKSVKMRLWAHFLLADHRITQTGTRGHVHQGHLPLWRLYPADLLQLALALWSCVVRRAQISFHFQSMGALQPGCFFEVQHWFQGNTFFHHPIAGRTSKSRLH